MSALSAAERQKQYRKRQRELGFREIMLWVHDDDRKALKKSARDLAQQRRKHIRENEPVEDWLK